MLDWNWDGFTFRASACRRADRAPVSKDRNQAAFIRRRANFFEQANLPAAYDLAASRR
jgi:hypothetical protein